MPKNNSERILEYSSYVSEAKRFAVIILALSFSVCLLSLLKIHINSITNSKFEGEVIKDDQKTSSNQLVLESGFVESDDGLQKVRSNFSYAVIKDLNLSDEINLENVNSTLCKSSNLVSTSSCSNIVSGYAVIFRKQREVLFDGGVAMKICEYKSGRCDNVNSNTLKINSDSAVFVGSVFGAFVNVNDLQNKFGGGISFTGDNITLIKRDSSRLGRDYVAKSSLGSVIKSFNEHYLLNSSSFVANTSGGAKSIDAAYTNGVLNIKDRKKFAFYDIRSKNMFFKHNAVSEIGTVLLDGDHSKVEKISADGSRTNIDSKKAMLFYKSFQPSKIDFMDDSIISNYSAQGVLKSQIKTTEADYDLETEKIHFTNNAFIKSSGSSFYTKKLVYDNKVGSGYVDNPEDGTNRKIININLD